MSQVTTDTTLEVSTSVNPKFSIQGYFSRIGYEGSTEPTLVNLRAIHKLHAQAIPFENLNPFLRIPVMLDIDSLYRKLVLNRRGGYCFEHNLLLMETLKTMGYDVKGLAARVIWNSPEGTLNARGHMLLLITLDKSQFLADAGFGGLTLTAPLLLKPEVEQHTPHENFKLTQSGEEFILHANVQGMWKHVYSFGLQQNFLPDYEVASWYLSNHPTSHFVTGLIAAIPFDNGRHTLRNNDFATHFLNGDHDRKRIDNVDEMKAILENTFQIVLPEIPHLDDSLQRIIHPSTGT
jgi:N-hydroxyarylamine O-acetyltransferase